MKVTYFGHSCFLVSVNGFNLLVDPFITPNSLASSIDVGSIPADYILISHAHFDHLADAEDIARRTDATLVSNFEIVEWFSRKGLEKAHPMNIGGGFDFPFGRAKMTPAIHSSSFPDGTYGGAPGGFVVAWNEGAFYYAGDTALTSDMELVAGEFAIDLAILPIGDNFTMGATDAARAASMIGCDDVLGVHYDTFPPIRIDHEAAYATFAEAGKRLHLLDIGAECEFSE